MLAAFVVPSWASRARGGAARLRCVAFLGVLLLGGLGVATPGDAARAAWAGDASTASPPAGDLAEALRAAAVRMELALEKARWLQARGRRDEALAVLDDAMRLHDEVHVRWRAASAAGAASAPPPATRAPDPRALEPMDVADAAVDAAVIDAARRYLLDRQRPDGHFAEPLERLVERDPAREGERQEVETGLVVAALCDLEGQRPLDAIRRAASALARASASGERPLHPIAAWGLASALTHRDEPQWRREVLRAVEAVLDAAEASGRDDAGPEALRAPAARVVDRAWASVLLHEVLPMAGPNLAQRIEGRLVRWRVEARTTSASRDAAPEVRAARDLVAGLRVGDGGAHFRPTPDASEFLSGSVLLFFLAANDRMDALDRSAAAQVRDGLAAGSWPPRPAVGPWGGRIAQTALHLLAARMPDTGFVPPVTTGLGG